MNIDWLLLIGLVGAVVVWSVWDLLRGGKGYDL